MGRISKRGPGGPTPAEPEPKISISVMNDDGVIHVSGKSMGECETTFCNVFDKLQKSRKKRKRYQDRSYR